MKSHEWNSTAARESDLTVRGQDTAALRGFYPGMKRYIDYLTSKADPETGLVSYGLSDWTCTQVRKTPSWPRSSANFSLLYFSHL